MLGLKKVIFYVVAAISLIVMEGVVIDYISNTVTAFFLTSIIWAVVGVIIMHYFDKLKEKYASSDFVVVDRRESFVFILDFDDKHYEGTIFPSLDTDKKGFPAYFRIDFGTNFYAAIKLERA